MPVTYLPVALRLAAFMGDSPDDPDDNPDLVYCDSGRVIFEPRLKEATLTQTGGNVLTGQMEIAGSIGPDGWVRWDHALAFTPETGVPHVKVVDLTSESLEPRITSGATHVFRIVDATARGQRVTFPRSGQAVRLTEAKIDPELGVINLADQATSPAPTIVQVVAGPQGKSVETLEVEDNELVTVLSDGTRIVAGPLPVSTVPGPPGGSDEETAARITSGPLTKAALTAQTVDLVEEPGDVRDAVDGRTLTVGDTHYGKRLLAGSPLVRSMPDAAVMSSPPTLSASSTAPAAFSRTLRLASGNTNHWPGFRISGAPYVSDGNTTTARSQGATKTTPGTNAWGGCSRIEFDLYGDGFAFTSQVPASFFFKVWVNGQPHSAVMQAGSTVSGVSGSGSHHFTVDFGSVAQRRITLELASLPASPSLTQGLRFKPTATVTPPTIPSPRFMVIGDSYAYGTGATDVADAYSIALGRFLGFAAVWNFTGVPSTGTLKADTANLYGGYSTRFASDVLPNLRDYDVCIYQGSVNDGSETAGAAQAQATADLAALKAAKPLTYFIATSPVYMTTPSASHTRVRNEIEAAAAANGVPFVDLIDTSLGLFYGTGTVAAPTGDGNADVNARDVGGIHPTTAGAKALARRAAKLIGEKLGQTAA